MRRFWKFLTAMASTYQLWLKQNQQPEPHQERRESARLRVHGVRPNIFPPEWSHEHLVEHALAEILINQHDIMFRLESLEEKTMDALAALNQTISDLDADVDAFIANNSGGATNADLAAANTRLQGIIAKLTAAPAPVA